MAVLEVVALTGVLEILAPAEVDRRVLPDEVLEDEETAAAAAAKPTLLTRGFSGDLALNSVRVRLFKPVDAAALDDDDLGLGVADIYEYRGLLTGPVVRFRGEVKPAGVEQALG